MTEHVGDITSNAVGSAARYNAGKDRLDLYPISVLTPLWTHGQPSTEQNRKILAAMNLLTMWEERRGTSPKDSLFGVLSLIDRDGQLAAAVLEYGQRKYAAWNWTKGMKWSVCKASILRHIRAMLAGEADDPESGLPHWGHIACNLVFLIYYADHFPQGDDRPPVWEKESEGVKA